ncbi:small GTP-binding protein, putative [Trichomonas vaginalis G3]|uniref:Small GTP-binding protein, putative n=2 Tax=Trichomonas vaginalis TaxID=5722 RepID=A0A8U0WNW6_TRIV3|nr:small Rab GTPase RabA1 [Trichomonas vaginalis G3]AAX97457.1 small Rab GTPase RabA1 [Trichomonas vaginalis]EAY15808.1 small GTP-binding protein, putative [Trichomonas vaginalis G3]KAI5525021.1 small Rab GTPase RabA1 [Trichomonas vaginalis G3]|eukprot:XP_001328031.1 small GTP-binding protein [Trichomonas vaginalis G3]
MESSSTFKFIIIGSSGVGKTALLRRLVENKFVHDQQSTIGVEFDSTSIEVDDQVVKLQIWDTAGQERFRSIAKAYFRNAVGVVLVFDVTERRTFDDVNMWLNDVHSLCDPSARVILVGNKTDLADSRVIPVSEAEAYANHRKLAYIETSARAGDNVKAVFTKLATEVYRSSAKDPSVNPKSITATGSTTEKSGCC